MPRYITHRFVLDDQNKLASFCVVDRTRTAEVKTTPDVTVLHVSRYWSSWSDAKVIRRESAMREDRLCLSEVATSLIDLVVDANRYLLSETSPEGYTFEIYRSREPAERDLATFGVSLSAHASA